MTDKKPSGKLISTKSTLNIHAKHRIGTEIARNHALFR